MITLSEAAKYTTNMVKKGVIEEIIKDSMILQKLSFMDIVGNALQYLRENSLGTANFYAPNEVWMEDTGDVTQVTASITILGGDADIDNFLKATRANLTDFEAETIQSKAKSVKHEFLNNFFYGDVATNTKSFDGVQKIITPLTGQQVNQGSGTTGAALSYANLEAAVDLVLDGKPDCLVMPKVLRRRLNQYLRSKGNVVVNSTDDYGNRFSEHDGIPVYVDDFMTTTETISSGRYATKTGGATMSILGLKFGNKELFGMQNGGLETKKLGQLMDKDGHRWRIKWYCGLGLGRTTSIMRVDGITNAAVVD